VKEVHEVIKVSKASPIWKAYIDYVNNIVLNGIAESIICALRHLNDQIDPKHIQRNDLPPMFEIKLEL